MGAVGLALGASMGGLFELWRLLRALERQELDIRLPVGPLIKMLGVAIVAMAPIGAFMLFASSLPMLTSSILALAGYVALYLSVSRMAGLVELDYWTGSFRRRLR